MRPTRRSLMMGAAALGLTGPARAAKPQRIVSLNPCIDAILVRLVDRERIAALSHYARERESSTIADIAETLPMTYETAEEVAMLAPDLVLTTRHNAIATRQALDALGIRSILFGVPETIADSLDQVSEIAAAVGENERGAALIAEIEAALAAAAPPPGSAPIDAVIFQARGFSPGAGTLADEMLSRTGFNNVAARYGLTKWGYIPLELLVAQPPQLLLAAQASPGAPTWAERVLSHPALDAVKDRMKRSGFGEALIYCGGPVLMKTAATLAAARDAFWEGRL